MNMITPTITELENEIERLRKINRAQVIIGGKPFLVVGERLIRKTRYTSQYDKTAKPDKRRHVTQPPIIIYLVEEIK